jgi:transketolase
MQSVERQTINAIRILSAEAVEKAKSGHPGLPMGAAAMAYALWARQMKHDPAEPNWRNRDRFILSAGHGSMLLYSLLHLFGYGLSLEDIRQFRQWGSPTPGHPEYGHTVGVETTTGPLGQGIANGVGMALAEAYLAARFNRPGYAVVDHYTYVLCGDGCLMEGISYEAASLAGTLKLGKLIVLYDSNDITIEGSTDIAFTEDVGKRFEAMGWHVQQVEDGNDVDAISGAIAHAKAETDKPSLIRIRTQIGFGCPKQGSAEVHGSPLGAECLAAAKDTLGWPIEPAFYVPDAVYAHTRTIQEKGSTARQAWERLFAAYRDEYPELAEEWERWHQSELPIDLLADEDFWHFDEGKMATRASSGVVLNRLAARIPNLIGGSADLAPSNNSEMKGRGYFSAEDRSGSNIHFGVREHAMAAIANGMMLHGGLRPYVATFFVFSDYMKPAMRLSAMMKLPVVYILTHDSIAVGEDGPTHEPIEQLASLRSIPNFTVFRPADSRETAAGWYAAMTRRTSPTGLVLTRQALPLLPGTGKEALKGGYVLRGSGSVSDIILMASGSEVSLILEAAERLAQKGIRARVVSMPSFELFEEQDPDYRESVLPEGVQVRLAVEAASPFGWHQYVGLKGAVIGMTGFGASAPGDELFKRFGFTVEAVVEKALELLGK